MSETAVSQNPLFDAQTIKRFTDAGWWGELTVSDMVRSLAAREPDRPAYISESLSTSWAEYDAAASSVAETLANLELADSIKIALFLPDTVHFHFALVGTSRARRVAVGIGARAGNAEVAHLIKKTAAEVIVTLDTHRGETTQRLVTDLNDRGSSIRFHVVLDNRGVASVSHVRGTSFDLVASDSQRPGSRPVGRRLGPNELFMLNATSGTTGLPKCVMQFENRWIHFVDLARNAGHLGDNEIVLAAVPAPYGFGLWTSHFAPAVLGATAVVMPKFNVDEMIRLIERERVTVLACVSTQFKMLLKSPLAREADLSSLRIMFTGGEAIPFSQAAQFEERTGASVLQFYGSNEAGALSLTTLEDTRENRLTTAGKVVGHMSVRIFDESGLEVLHQGTPGQPSAFGPTISAGYYDDPIANSELYGPDGSVLLGDIVTIDNEGYLKVVGRTSDIIIRGGKNISAAEVEEEVGKHPAIELVTAVAIPDELFGEKVCAVLTTQGNAVITVDSLHAFLTEKGVSLELHPEYVVQVPEMPTSSGGKVAKKEALKHAMTKLRQVSAT